MSRRLGALACTVSGLAILVSTPALAQSAAPADATFTVEDVVVTAQRRSESIRDVPFAVTAVNQETLA
ncbi:MAG: hypothetical protein EON94_11510, partial [Caulobacteraceae bacterium]